MEKKIIAVYRATYVSSLHGTSMIDEAIDIDEEPEYER